MEATSSAVPHTAAAAWDLEPPPESWQHPGRSSARGQQVAGPAGEGKREQKYARTTSMALAILGLLSNEDTGRGRRTALESTLGARVGPRPQPGQPHLRSDSGSEGARSDDDTGGGRRGPAGGAERARWGAGGGGPGTGCGRGRGQMDSPRGRRRWSPPAGGATAPNSPDAPVIQGKLAASGTTGNQVAC